MNTFTRYCIKSLNAEDGVQLLEKGGQYITSEIFKDGSVKVFTTNWFTVQVSEYFGASEPFTLDKSIDMESREAAKQIDVLYQLDDARERINQLEEDLAHFTSVNQNLGDKNVELEDHTGELTYAISAFVTAMDILSKPQKKEEREELSFEKVVDNFNNAMAKLRSIHAKHGMEIPESYDYR